MQLSSVPKQFHIVKGNFKTKIKFSLFRVVSEAKLMLKLKCTTSLVWWEDGRWKWWWLPVGDSWILQN